MATASRFTTAVRKAQGNARCETIRMVLLLIAGKLDLLALKPTSPPPYPVR
jgi:hypothetical protein